jgi:hypothetical protein
VCSCSGGGDGVEGGRVGFWLSAEIVRKVLSIEAINMDIIHANKSSHNCQG